jgi:hypothetical protein
MPLSARAIRVADVWVVEIPTVRLRISVVDLDDVEQHVAAAIASGSPSGRPGPVRVEIGRYLHLDDSTTELVRRRRETVALALRAHRAG